MEHTKMYEALRRKGYSFNLRNCMEEFDCMLHDEILKHDSILSNRYLEIVDIVTTAVKNGEVHYYEKIAAVYDKYEDECDEAERNIKSNSEEYAGIMYSFGLMKGFIIGALGICSTWALSSLIKKLKK